MGTTPTFTIPEIAKAYKEGILFAPPVQRGLVWNAARIEILWDSLMRHIPIGALSIRSSANNRWEIFDGQQRANALALGLFPYEINDPQHKKDSIIWLDICPQVTNLEQSDGSYGKTARKFFFRVTTAAHPWGYKLSDNETSNKYLSAGEQREIIEVDFKDYSWEKKQYIAARPYPFELWPKDAFLPVPFFILYDFCSHHLDTRYSSFLECCKAKFQANIPNWYRNFTKQETVPQEKYWNSIVSAIRSLSEISIQTIDANDVDESDIGLYFKRMNKAGLVPSDDEINYSLLKSIAEPLKKIDGLAEKVGLPPAQMASIALRYWKSKIECKFIVGISIRDVSNFSRNEEFKEFICGKSESSLEKLVEVVDVLLNIHNPDGLLAWHRSLLARRDAGVIFLLLLKEAAAPRSGINYSGLAMLLSVFSIDLIQTVRHLWDADTIPQGIFLSLQSHTLEFPLFEDELEAFLRQTTGDTWYTAALQFLNNPQYATRFKIIWPGFDKRKHAIEILLYSCQKYLRYTFNDYDTSAPEWQEQNCPWDYDHILPRAWIRAQDRTGNLYTAICSHFLWSIGNCAPIPFSLNRGKNQFPPGVNYPFGQQVVPVGIQSDNGLCVDKDQIEKYKSKVWFDNNENTDNIKVFITTTARRIYNLYMIWYRNLDIKNFLDFSSFVDSRKNLLSEIAKQTGAEVYYEISGQDYPINNAASCRWATPSISVGKIVADAYFIVYRTEKQEHLKNKIGIRKLPSESEISQLKKEKIAKILNVSEYPIQDRGWYACTDNLTETTENIIATIIDLTLLVEKTTNERNGDLLD